MTQCELPKCDTEPEPDNALHRSDFESVWIAMTALGASTGGDKQFRVCPDCYEQLRNHDEQTTRQGVRDTEE